MATPADQVRFLSGVTDTGAVAGTSFHTWFGNNPATYRTTGSTTAKWGTTTAATAATVNFYFDNASSWTTDEKAVFTSAFALWSSLANITFVDSSSTPNPATQIKLQRGATDSGAYAEMFRSSNLASAPPGSTTLREIRSATVNIETGTAGSGPFGPLVPGDFETKGGNPWNTVLHEIGHALGLGHGGPYDGAVVTSTQQFNEYDTTLWTIMSYVEPRDTNAKFRSQYPVTGTNWGTAPAGGGLFYHKTAVTPMALDILAMQRLYGATPATNYLSGGQIYGFNSNINTAIRSFFDFTVNTRPVVTLFNSGTGNTLDLSGYGTATSINLNPGTFSSCAGLVNNLCIAYGTSINAFYGSTGADTVLGNSNGNLIVGGGGNDTITGGSGNDLIAGDSGTNTLDGGLGLDTLRVTGLRAAYSLTYNGNGSITVNGGAEISSIVNFEFIQFNDLTMTLNGAGTDLDGDRDSDLVWQAKSGQVKAWLMNGLSVSSTGDVADPGRSWRMRGSGDFNGDGKSDIVLQEAGGQAAIWSMNGTSLSSATLVGPNPGASWRLRGAGDFNGDGKGDLLWQRDDGLVCLWLMNGTTIASAPALLNPGPAWTALAAGDFNGDGKSDILLQGQDGTVGVWLLDGGTITSAPVVSNPGSNWRAKTTGDFNGDGKSDILLQNEDGQAAVWLMNGGSLSSGGQVGPNPGPLSHVMGAGDFDRDGKSDIIWEETSGQATLWLMNGTSVANSSDVGTRLGVNWQVGNAGITFPTPPRFDYNADGKADILLQNDNGQAGIWFMDGSTITSAPIVGPNPGPAWRVRGSGDFNADGRTDMLWQNANGQVGIWFMNGAGVSDAPAVTNPGVNWRAQGSGDFDGDGKSDILLRNDGGQAAVWLMNGSAIASGGQVGSNLGTGWTLGATGDFDGDGKSDLLWQNSNGQMAIWFMNGLTVAGTAQVANNPGSVWEVRATGDFNGDGKADIVLQNRNDHQASIWTMNGAALADGYSIGGVPGPSWNVVGAEDLNGDGRSELLWQQTSGQVSAWFVNGATVLSTPAIGSNPGSSWQIAGTS